MIQAILEESCFEFGRLWLPEVLKARSCECMESMELTRWTRLLVRYHKDLPLRATAEISGVSFRDALFKSHQIRHVAVHRRLISVCEVEKMIESAVSLTTVLKDASRTRKIRLIQREAGTKLEELKRVQNGLETRMSKELTAIGQRRALLDELEKTEVELMLTGAHQNRVRLGSALDEFLMRRHICTDSTLRPPEEMSRAEGDDATLEPHLA